MVLIPVAVIALIRAERPRELYGFLGNVATILGGIAIIVGLWRYWRGEADRRKAKHYQAWQVLNSAEGKGGSGGRIDALQDLATDKVSLAGINLDRAWLQNLTLTPRTSLSNASLRGANLMGAHLEGVILEGAHLEGANLQRAHLKGASLAGAYLREATLGEADLREANLWESHLECAILVRAYLTGAILEGSHLQGADLSGARLKGAVLGGFIYHQMGKFWLDVRMANISGISYAPDGFREWALAHGAVEIDNFEESREHLKNCMIFLRSRLSSGQPPDFPVDPLHLHP